MYFLPVKCAELLEFLPVGDVFRSIYRRPRRVNCHRGTEQGVQPGMDVAGIAQLFIGKPDSPRDKLQDLQRIVDVDQVVQDPLPVSRAESPAL